MLSAEADVRARWIAATLDAALSTLTASGACPDALRLIGKARKNAAGLADELAPSAELWATRQRPHARAVAADGSNVLPFPSPARHRAG